MNRWRFVLPVFLLLLSFSPANAQSKTIAERLGYPADAKLLIIHADDLGVSHSVDAASFDAIEKRAVTSASVMVPCPWLLEVSAYAKTHADADLGLHLTLNSEWKTYRWGPVAPKDVVPGLLDFSGSLWSESRQVVAHSNALEVEREIRAQIEEAIALAIRPSHLDTHMGTLFASQEFFGAYVKVAHEYGFPFLVAKVNDERANWMSVLSDKDIVLDAVVGAGEDVRPEQWKDFYVKSVQELKPGLTEMIVHLGHDDAELQAVMVDHPAFGSAWRQRDYDVVNSAEFKKALQENHVVLVGWKDLQRIANGR